MKKIIISLLFSLIAFTASADHEENINSFYMSELPGLCGRPEAIQTYLEHYKFVPQNISLGREGMVVDGQPVFMITYYVSEDGTQTTATIDIPSGTERCLMYHTFDLTSAPE